MAPRSLGVPNQLSGHKRDACAITVFAFSLFTQHKALLIPHTTEALESYKMIYEIYTIHHRKLV